MKEFIPYYKLRDKADQLTAQLSKQHRQHMACKKGCDLCCMDFSIFPIEFFSIRAALSKKDLSTLPSEANDENSCVFLQNHACTIYSERPIICRTHGLPLLYMNDDSQWELSACELNFTNFDMEKFTSENTFPQDQFNSELFMLNKAFIATLSEKNYTEFDLIPTKQLLSAFGKNEQNK